MTTTPRTLLAIVLVAAFAGPAASQGPNRTWAPLPAPAAKAPATVVMESLAIQRCRRHCDSLATGVHTVDTVPVRLARQERCSRKMVKG